VGFDEKKKVGENLSFQEDFLFWRLARFFISDCGYRIVHLSKNQQELWLEKLENKNVQVIRLLKHELTWSNWMQRDIELTATNGENIRKQLNKRNINILNIYVSAFLPVDEYQFRIEKPFTYPGGGKTVVKSIIVERSSYNEQIQEISKILMENITIIVKENYEESDIETEKQMALNSAKQVVKAEKDLFENGRPFFTYVFLGIQVILFLLMEFLGGSTSTTNLIRFGAKVNGLILDGEWWRFFTPIVIHIGFLHLIMNSFALYYLGRMVEQIYGNIRFFFIYLFAGFFGVLTSFLFSTSISAGASGAIFGCFGALLYFGSAYPKLFFRTMGTNIIVVIIINLVFGFTFSGVDNAGHIGGLIGGFLASCVFHLPKKKRPFMQVVSLVVSIFLIYGLLHYGFSEPEKRLDDQSALILANEYMSLKENEKAYRILSGFQPDEEHSSEFYFYLANSEFETERLDDAKVHYKLAINKNKRFHEAHYNLALVYLKENNLPKAKEYISNAVKLIPENSDYKELQNYINEAESAGGA
jgi:rhomboid protease GluP